MSIFSMEGRERERERDVHILAKQGDSSVVDSSTSHLHVQTAHPSIAENIENLCPCSPIFVGPSN